MRSRLQHETRLERLETQDGDFLDLHHLDAAPRAPLLVLLHGLEGSIRSHYIQGLLGEASRRGWRAAVRILTEPGASTTRAKRLTLPLRSIICRLAIETLRFFSREFRLAETFFSSSSAKQDRMPLSEFMQPLRSRFHTTSAERHGASIRGFPGFTSVVLSSRSGPRRLQN